MLRLSKEEEGLYAITWEEEAHCISRMQEFLLRLSKRGGMLCW